ncbi:MAG: flagellin [Deltaproteobacteria bacterium]|nr:flagellin [Deltaproteobacteria bacterium]
MSLNIRTNLASLQAQRNLYLATEGLNTTYARLSSGLRINRAKDDAAGLAIAESLKADQKLASVAIRNANDGISIVAITDAAIDQISKILTRLAELAEQSANGVYDNVQRSALSREFHELMSEVERIALTTEFNGLKLLSGGGTVTLQVGLDGSSLSQITYSGIQATLQALGLANTGSSAHIYSILGTTNNDSQIAARSALDALRSAIATCNRQRGTLGSAESRLEAAIRNLQASRESFAKAESAIRDADVAAEAAELARLTILQQAATAILAQANQQPSLALQLLRG